MSPDHDVGEHVINTITIYVYLYKKISHCMYTHSVSLTTITRLPSLGWLSLAHFLWTRVERQCQEWGDRSLQGQNLWPSSSEDTSSAWWDESVTKYRNESWRRTQRQGSISSRFWGQSAERFLQKIYHLLWLHWEAILDTLLHMRSLQRPA